MTDDKAPVELLGMQVIDQLIQEEVAYYKDIYEEQGISGLKMCIRDRSRRGKAEAGGSGKNRRRPDGMALHHLRLRIRGRGTAGRFYLSAVQTPSFRF